MPKLCLAPLFVIFYVLLSAEFERSTQSAETPTSVKNFCRSLGEIPNVLSFTNGWTYICLQFFSSWSIKSRTPFLAPVIIANGALQITSNQPGHPDHGLARAAQIMGWVMIAITILGIIAWVFFVVLIGGVGLLAGA